MEEIEQMEQQPIVTESVFATVEPLSAASTAAEVAAAAVVTLSNAVVTNQQQQQQDLGLQDEPVVKEEAIATTATTVNTSEEFVSTATDLPTISANLQLASVLPMAASLVEETASTSMSGTPNVQIASDCITIPASDLVMTPIQTMQTSENLVAAADEQTKQSLEAVKEWMVRVQEPGQQLQQQKQETIEAPLTSTPKLSRRRYTIEFKLMAVDYTKNHSKNETARHFKVHKKQIQEWCKHHEDLAAIKTIVDSGGKITRGHGRRSPFRSNAGLRPYSIAIDNAVRDYFVDCTKEGIKVTKRMLQEKAYELHHSRTDGNPNFTGSDGWLTKFVQRHNINLKDGTIDSHVEQDFISQTEPQIGAQEGPDEMVASTGEMNVAIDTSTSGALDIVKLDTQEMMTPNQSLADDVEGADISTTLLDSSSASTPLRPKRKQYSTEEKEYIANHARVDGVSNTVFKFGIPEETIRHWMKIDFTHYREWKSQVKKKGTPKRKNAPGAGRPLKYPREIDLELRDWIVQQQTDNNPISEQALREKAQELIEPHCPSFKHSSSWLKSFMQRHKLNDSTVEGTEVYMGETGQDMYIDTIADDTYVATDVQAVASQYVTASGVTLLIRQDTEQGDTYDEVNLKEYSMDALKNIVSGRLGITEDSINRMLKEKHRKDGNAVWVRVSTDEDVLRLQDDDLISIVMNQ